MAVVACFVAMVFAAQAQVDVTSRAAVFPGPCPATIVGVTDGDTIGVSIALWPGLRAEYSIRIRGMDTPEIFRPECEAERDWGERARAQAQKLYPSGPEVQITNVQHDSFSGRVAMNEARPLRHVATELTMPGSTTSRKIAALSPVHRLGKSG